MSDRLEAIEAVNDMYKKVCELFIADQSKENEVIKLKCENLYLREQIQKLEGQVVYYKRKCREAEGYDAELAERIKR